MTRINVLILHINQGGLHFYLLGLNKCFFDVSLILCIQRVNSLVVVRGDKPYAMARATCYPADINMERTSAYRYTVVSCSQHRLLPILLCTYHKERWQEREGVPVPMVESETLTWWLCWMWMPSVLGLSPGAVMVTPVMWIVELKPTTRCIWGLLMSLRSATSALLQNSKASVCIYPS